MPKKLEETKDQILIFTRKIDKLAEEYNAEIVIVANFPKAEKKQNSIIHFSGFVLEDYKSKKEALDLATTGFQYKHPEIKKLEII